MTSVQKRYQTDVDLSLTPISEGYCLATMRHKAPISKSERDEPIAPWNINNSETNPFRGKPMLATHVRRSIGLVVSLPVTVADRVIPWIPGQARNDIAKAFPRWRIKYGKRTHFEKSD